MSSESLAGKAPTHKSSNPKQTKNSAPAKATASAAPQAAEAAQRATEQPAALSPADVIALQRAAGNRATTSVLSASPGQPPAGPGKFAIQAKLTVGPAGDKYEQEAERVAGQVMRSTALGADDVGAHGRAPLREDELGLQAMPLAGGISRLQRQEDDEEEDDDEMQAKPMPGGLQRAEGAEDEDVIRSKPADGSGGFSVGGQIENRVRATAGSGNPLPDTTRSFMENRFGVGLGSVRVHTGGEPAQLNRQINAQAFTHGSDIYMGAGKYSPGTNAGKHLLAHELTHVVQQTGGAHLKRKAAQRSTLKAAPGIQRYAANIFDKGATVNWPAETASVTRPGEGKSGGVFFFTSTAGPVNKAVIKPEYSENRGTVDVTDTFLKTMRFSVPNSRVVDLDTPEGVALKATAADKGAAIPPGLELMGEEKPLTYLRVMESVPGKSVSSVSAKAGGSMSDVNDLIKVLESEHLLFSIGRLAAFDGFIGMGDRIRQFGVNLGNIMFQKDAYGVMVTAIDNESTLVSQEALVELTKNKGRTSQQLDDVTVLFDRRDSLFKYFKIGISAAINNNQLLTEFGINMDDPASLHGMSPEQYELTGQTQSQAQHFEDYYNFDQWRAWFYNGIDQGIRDLMDMLKSKRFKKAKKGLKKAFKKGGANWDAVRVREKYLELRNQGMDEDAAVEEAQRYAKYRQGRNRTVRGFKWTQKLKYKKGGFG